MRVHGSIWLCAVFGAASAAVAEPEARAPYQSALGSDIVAVEYFEDASQALTLDDVRQRPDWIKSDPRINLGLSSSAIWLKLTIVNREPPDRQLFVQFDEPLLQHIAVSVPDGEGRFMGYRLGFLEPNSYRNVFGSPLFTFPAGEARNVETVHYARIVSPTALRLSMALRGEAEAYLQARDESWTFGLIYGVLLFMPLYNLVVFLFSRDRSFLIPAGFTFCLCMTYLIVQGHLSLALPDLSLWIKDRVHNLFGAATYVLLLVLTRELLVTRANAPRLDKVMVVAGAVSLAIPICGLFGNHFVYAMLGMMMTLTISVLVVSASIVCLTKVPMAGFFLVGFSFFIAGSVIFVLQLSGAVPSNFWTVHAVHFGGIFEEAFLACAVAFKIKSLGKSLKQRAAELERANANLSSEMQHKERMAKELGIQRSIAIHSSKMRAIGEVASSIAHQVNNPLAILRMKLDNLTFSLEKLDVPNDQRQKLIEQFDGAERNIARIAKITGSLLRLSRNTEREEMSPTPVLQILAEGLDTCVDRFEEHGVRVRQVGFESVSDLALTCHATDVSQALLNLLKNSYDAVHGTHCPWIEVGVRRTGAALEFSVTDSGGGIPEDLRDKIMQPFFTTKDAGKGTGVGLSIASDLVRASGGRIVLDTDCPNTRFALIFPLTACKQIAA